MKQLNEAQIVKKWSPLIESTTGLKDEKKIGWISKYAHYHALNEAAQGGVSSPYSTLLNTPGVGNATPASAAATTGGQFYGANAQGSGDKWPALLPMSLQVAARTIGFDIVNVVPMPGPTGVIAYLDYVYAGGKQPYGAKPASNPSNGNPSIVGDSSAYLQFEAPDAFKLNITDASTMKAGLSNGDDVTFTGGLGSLGATYIGKSRIDGFAMFKTGTFTTASNLAEVFDGGSVSVQDDASTLGDAAVANYPALISTLEDQVQGFAGAGATDNDDWDGTFVDGTNLYEPMERGVGEQVYPRHLGLQLFTKFIQVGTYQIAVNVTQEQIQDLNKQWGIDVIAMVENAGINDISQAINKHILSRAFGLGWKNHVAAYDVEQINLNLRLDASTAGTTPAYAYPGESGGVGGTQTSTMVLPGFSIYPQGSTTSFENQDTVIKRVFAHILAAGNVVAQRGRRGAANFVVTNLKIATALQSNAQYGFSPFANTFNQNNGSLYPLGTVAGMTVYVDPNMTYEDTRVLVGRKGSSDEPGIVFCPYLMAESVKLITEGTGAPKVIIKSRYALVDAGWHPETQYITLYIKTSTIGGII